MIINKYESLQLAQTINYNVPISIGNVEKRLLLLYTFVNIRLLFNVENFKTKGLSVGPVTRLVIAELSCRVETRLLLLIQMDIFDTCFVITFINISYW